MKFRFSFKIHDQGRLYFLKSYLWIGRERKIHWHAVWWIKFTIIILEDGLRLLVLISNILKYQLHFLCVQCTLLYNTSALILNPVQYHTSLRLTTLKQDDTLIDFVTNVIWTSFHMCLKTNPDCTWKRWVLGNNMSHNMYISSWKNMPFFSLNVI